MTTRRALRALLPLTAVATLGLGLAGCGATFAFTGYVNYPAGSIANASPVAGNVCPEPDPNVTPNSDTTVTVLDPSGSEIASDKLGEPVDKSGPGVSGQDCVLMVDMQVPDGLSTYTIKVGDGDAQGPFTLDEMHAGPELH